MAQQTINNSETGLVVRGKINDNFTELYTEKDKCSVYRSSAQSIDTATFDKISFDTELIDTNSMYSAGTPTRITIKTSGTYLITVSMRFAFNATNARSVNIKLNDTTYLAREFKDAIATATFQTTLDTTAIASLSVNDYVEAEVYQDSGGALNVEANQYNTPVFSVIQLA